MPELAEVEHERKATHDHCVGKRIVKVQVQDDDIVYSGITATEFAAHVDGKTIVDTGRHGKYFFVLLSDGPHILLHLGMTGTIRIKNARPLNYRRPQKEEHANMWPPRFWKFVCTLDDGTEWSYTNARRFGRIKLVNDPLGEPPISLQGFDPLLAMPTLQDFSKAVTARSLPIKALLLDQTFSAGLGNWMVDEVCYQAAIHPSQPCDSLDDDQLARIHFQIHDITRKAVEANADVDFFPKEWLFHSRWSKGKNGTFNGQKIEFKTVGGRTSAIIPSVQKLVKVTKPKEKVKTESKKTGTTKTETTSTKTVRKAAGKPPVLKEEITATATATNGNKQVTKKMIKTKTTTLPTRKRKAVAAISDSVENGNGKRRSTRLSVA